MRGLRWAIVTSTITAFAALFFVDAPSASADGSLRKVQHIVIVMQENHSFDNYLGTLAYAPGSPYHSGPCQDHDHACVDGLTCQRDDAGNLRCLNFNRDDNRELVVAFHEPDYCVKPDLNHEWLGSHMEANYADPRNTMRASLNDGFVRVNDATEQPDLGCETPFEDETMGFYTEADLPFYLALAQTFAISDRYFASILGPTFPNRAYALAATSFGHLNTA